MRETGGLELASTCNQLATRIELATDFCKLPFTKSNQCKTSRNTTKERKQLHKKHKNNTNLFKEKQN